MSFSTLVVVVPHVVLLLERIPYASNVRLQDLESAGLIVLNNGSIQSTPHHHLAATATLEKHGDGVACVLETTGMAVVDYKLFPPVIRRNERDVYGWVHHHHPNVLTTFDSNHVELFIAALYTAPRLDRMARKQLNEAEWKAIIDPLLVTIVLAANRGQMDEEGNNIPADVMIEYRVSQSRTSLLGLELEAGTDTDASFGISKFDFKVYEQEREVQVDVGDFYDDNVKKIYVGLNTNTHTQAVFPFCHYELKGYNNPPKDGTPQAFTVMSSSLCLYAHIKALADKRDKVAFQQWEEVATVSEIAMMERCYGVVAHEAQWTIYIMVIHLDGDGRRRFLVKPIISRDVTTVQAIHQLNEVICRILREADARKAILQEWLSMATASAEELSPSPSPSPSPPTSKQSLPPSSHHSSPHTDSDRHSRYTRRHGELVVPSAAAAAADASVAGPSTKRPPSSATGGPSMSAVPSDNLVGKRERWRAPWRGIEHTSERRRVAKAWWNSLGLKWSMQASGSSPPGYQPPRQRVISLPSPPITPTDGKDLMSKPLDTDSTPNPPRGF